MRPASRAQAVAALTAGAELPVPCLSPILHSLLDEPRSGSPAARRAVGILQGAAHLYGERRWVDPDGTAVRFTLQRNAFDRVDVTDDDANGRPDVIEAVLAGLAEARRVLVGQLGLPSPDPVEVLVAEIGGNVEGYVVPAGGAQGRPLLVIDATPAGGASAARGAVVHQYAHAVALVSGSGLTPDWSEALATFAGMHVTGGPDPRTALLLGHRLDRMSEGLETESLEIAAGNALWLAFLEEAYGALALRLAVEELSGGPTAPAGFDRALRRAAGESLAAALREFQLWGVLVGDRSNGRHFSFADRIPSPSFASESEGLPALAVQTDPPIAPLGAAAVRLRPREGEGGIVFRFEGDVPGRWEADLLIVRRDRSLQRVPVPLRDDGTGQVTIPASDLAEAVLLVRNTDTESQPPRKYAWSAHALRGYPFELAALSAVAGEQGTVVTWETVAESGLIGFNVLRLEEGADDALRVNGVWIPALGDPTNPAGYHFVDATADPERTYSYRIEGITEAGLAAVSESAVAAAPVARPLR